MSMVVLPSKAAGEKIPAVFDFASKLSLGETVSSATTQISVWSGVDASPNSVLSGTPSISGSRASQTVTGGVAGTIYKLTCTATTSLGNNPVLVGLLAVVQDPI